MSTNKDLPMIQNDHFSSLQRFSRALYESGYFKDVNSLSQAIVKVMAGDELGLPPFAAMTSIHIIKGKPVVGANAIATLVDNHPRYGFTVVVQTNAHSEIEWMRDGKVIGSSSYTFEEAAKAGLTNKDNWRKYPSDMLFARCISRGVKRFAPGVFAGAPIYTPEEMNVDTDTEGYVVEGQIQNESSFQNEPGLKTAGGQNEGGVENGGGVQNVPVPLTEKNLKEWNESSSESPGEIVEEQAEPETPPGDNPDPSDAVESCRAWLDEKGQSSLGIIADAAVMTGEYDDREHVRHTLEMGIAIEDDKPIEPEMNKLYEMGLWGKNAAGEEIVDFRRTVTKTLVVYDALMKRKGY